MEAWEWVLAAWFAISLAVVVNTWLESRAGYAKTTMGGYILVFFLWPAGICCWLIMVVFPNWGILKRNRRPPRA